MTDRAAVMDAIKAGRPVRIDLDHDDGFTDYVRLSVFFIHTDGREYHYASKPFAPTDYQGAAQQAALRIERLGLPRAYVLAWIPKHFDATKIDLTKLF